MSAFTFLAIALVAGILQTADAGVILTADPSSQTLIEKGQTGHIKFSIVNSQTTSFGGNDYTVPIQFVAIRFNGFDWVGGDPDKDDKPVNPHWAANVFSLNPLSKVQDLDDQLPPGASYTFDIVDFVFNTLPAHNEVPPDYDIWKASFTFAYFYPKTQSELNRYLSGGPREPWSGIGIAIAEAKITINDVGVPEPSSLTLWGLAGTGLAMYASRRRNASILR